MPTFSILIAVYNAAQWLDECFNSLTNQTYGDFEALCVDDCSTDESWTIVERRCAADPRFKAWRTPINSGAGAARNVALQHATGRYTLFLDADDTLSTTALAELCKAFGDGETEDNGVDAALLQLVMTWDDIDVEEDVPFPPSQNFSYYTGREACALNIDFRLHGVYAIRTAIHRRIPYITSPRHYGDDNTTLLHYLACRRIAISGAEYYYRHHPASSSHTAGLARLDLLEADCQRRRIIEEAQLGDEALQRCERHCWEAFVGRYIEFFYKNKPSAAHRREAHRRFASALRAMRPRRLGLHRPTHASFLFLRPYGLFRLWQSLLFHTKKCLHK